MRHGLSTTLLGVAVAVFLLLAQRGSGQSSTTVYEGGRLIIGDLSATIEDGSLVHRTDASLRWAVEARSCRQPAPRESADGQDCHADAQQRPHTHRLRRFHELECEESHRR